MAKPKKPGKVKKPAKAEALPVCTAMVFCNQVIEGNDHTLSLIRLVDTVGLPPGTSYETGQGIELNSVRLLAVLKKGGSHGKVSLSLVCTAPSGQRYPMGLATDMTFEDGAETGNAINNPARFHWEGAGVYWLELFANNSLIAKTPLKVDVPESKADEKPQKM